MSVNHISVLEKDLGKKKVLKLKSESPLQNSTGNGVDHTLNNSNSFFGINS